MAIDLSKISSLVNSYSTPNAKSTTNNLGTNFAEYLLQSTNTISNNTMSAPAIASSLQLNVNDTTSSNNAIVQALQGTSTSSLNALFNQSSIEPSNTSDLFSTLLDSSTSSNSTSTTDLFNSLLSSGSSNSSTALYDVMSSSTNTDSTNTTASGIDASHMTDQFNVLSAAQSKLQANLDDYKTRNENHMSGAVQQRIAEMSKNVSVLQSYIQDKIAEKATNNSLINQLQANSNNALATIQAKTLS